MGRGRGRGWLCREAAHNSWQVLRPRTDISAGRGPVTENRNRNPNRRSGRGEHTDEATVAATLVSDDRRRRTGVGFRPRAGIVLVPVAPTRLTAVAGVVQRRLTSVAPVPVRPGTVAGGVDTGRAGVRPDSLPRCGAVRAGRCAGSESYRAVQHADRDRPGDHRRAPPRRVHDHSSDYNGRRRGAGFAESEQLWHIRRSANRSLVRAIVLAHRGQLGCPGRPYSQAKGSVDGPVQETEEPRDQAR